MPMTSGWTHCETLTISRTLAPVAVYFIILDRAISFL